MTIADWAGLLSDILTFAGSAVLAVDAATAVTKFKDEQFRLQTLKSLGDHVPVETKDGHELQNAKDVHLEALRKIVSRAKIGIGLLLTGLLCQIVTRALEIFKT